MKKLLPLIFLILISTSCAGQKIDQLPIYKVVAVVDRIAGDETTLHTSGVNYYAASIPELVEKKKYVFWIEKNGRGKVSIVKFALTTDQAQKDQETAASELSNRKIIKQ